MFIIDCNCYLTVVYIAIIWSFGVVSIFDGRYLVCSVFCSKINDFVCQEVVDDIEGFLTTFLWVLISSPHGILYIGSKSSYCFFFCRIIVQVNHLL